MENRSTAFLWECGEMNGAFQVINAELDRRLAEFTLRRQEEVWQRRTREVKEQEKRAGVVRSAKAK